MAEGGDACSRRQVRLYHLGKIQQTASERQAQRGDGGGIVHGAKGSGRGKLENNVRLRRLAPKVVTRLQKVIELLQMLLKLAVCERHP